MGEVHDDTLSAWAEVRGGTLEEEGKGMRRDSAREGAVLRYGARDAYR